jgi:probable HAF family extracellular repeat protein
MPQGSHAFLYNEGLTPIDLGTLGGDSSASAINKGGQVVGTAKVGNESHAFLWQNGVMKDLNDLAPAGWELEVANDINDAGQIVGYGRLYGGGPRRGFVLTPTATGPSVVVDWPTNYWGWFSDYSPVSGSYLVTYCSGSGVYSTATWDFSVPSGRHHVWVYIPSSSAPSRRTRQAQYTIRDLAGINSWRVTHHQQYQYSTLQSGWVDLGEFPFVGGLARVELVDETGEPTWSTFVVADAVGWS